MLSKSASIKSPIRLGFTRLSKTYQRQNNFIGAEYYYRQGLIYTDLYELRSN